MAHRGALEVAPNSSCWAMESIFTTTPSISYQRSSQDWLSFQRKTCPLIKRQLRSSFSIVDMSSCVSGSPVTARRLPRRLRGFAENGIGICPRWTAHLMHTTAGCTPQPASDLTNCRILEGRRVFGCAVAFGPGGRSDGGKRNGLNAVLDQIPKELRLLEMGMKLHFICDRLDPRVAQQQPHLGNGHV